MVGALPAWVLRCVTGVMAAGGGVMTADVVAETEAAGTEAQRRVGHGLRALVDQDIDEQRTTPLALVRSLAVPLSTAVLERAGVAPVLRDDFEVRTAPEDHYDLRPRSLADIDPDLVELGIQWGAAKAWVHRHRHAD